MGTKIESIKEGSVEADLHNELMNPQKATDALAKAVKPSGSTDPGKDSYDTFDQNHVNLPSGPTTGDGNTGQKTTTLQFQKDFGLDKAANQPTQPSKDLGRMTGYD
jgi:hypothetical protein